MTLSETVRQVIRDRIAAGEDTIHSISTKSRVAYPRVYDWINGRQDRISSHLLDKLADAVGVRAVPPRDPRKDH